MNFDAITFELSREAASLDLAVLTSSRAGELLGRIFDSGEVAGSTPIATLHAFEPESIVLRLNNGYVFQEFEYEVEDQIATVRSFMRIAAAYKSGLGAQKVSRNWLGRRELYYEVELADGSRWSGREGKAPK